jgi:hypothetical protein
MQNMNERGLDIVQTPQVFLFTNRHLKELIPDFYCSEKSVYFFSKNNCLRVLHIQRGTESIQYETQPDQVLDQVLKNACPLQVKSIFILLQKKLEYSTMSIYWTTSVFVHPSNIHEYTNPGNTLLAVDGKYFDDFTKWLETNAATVFVHKEEVVSRT